MPVELSKEDEVEMAPWDKTKGFRECGIGGAIMEGPIHIDEKSCKKCGLCSEVCPNKIIEKDNSGQLSFRQDRIPIQANAFPFSETGITELS
jgi:ferredoxin